MNAEYKERIKEYYVEDITDHAEDDYFLGYIPFQFTSIKTVYKQTQDKIKRDVSYHLLETKADLKFKNGDIIRLDGINEYTIEEVEFAVDKKFQSLVLAQPLLKSRYTTKVLKLYDNK